MIGEFVNNDLIDIMEIGATSSSSYLPLQIAEPRVARHVAREPVVVQERVAAVDKERKENEKQRPPIPTDTPGLSTRQSGNTAETPVSRSAESERETRKATGPRETQSAQQQEVAAAAAGSIKMDIEDGDRVLKVFDSKDVLIYQMPPKGALMLIKAQEHAQQSQVQTSA